MSKKKAKKQKKSSGFKWFVFTLLLFAIAAAAARLTVFDVYKVTGDSMLPTYKIGDVIFSSRLIDVDELARGTVVEAYLPGEDGLFLRRVYGLPGDKIEKRSDGTYLVYSLNGVMMEHPLGEASALEEGVIPNDKYLLLADNSLADSRSFGLIDKANIKAETKIIIWPWDRMFRG